MAITPAGEPAVNPLTWMALRVARDVGLIDPKVNLRISAGTDQALLELATELTRKGLGFPQYANDDVVIPALVSHGYDIEDARDYTVAACWEFIIPGRGMDVGNIGAVSFPAAADSAIREGLAAGASFEEILERTREQIAAQVRERTAPYERLLWAPAPWYSVLMTDALERGVDHGRGAKYRNLGHPRRGRRQCCRFARGGPTTRLRASRHGGGGAAACTRRRLRRSRRPAQTAHRRESPRRPERAARGRLAREAL